MVAAPMANTPISYGVSRRASTTELANWKTTTLPCDRMIQARARRTFMRADRRCRGLDVQRRCDAVLAVLRSRSAVSRHRSKPADEDVQNEIGLSLV